MTEDQQKIIFGFCLLIILALLTAATALGKVHKESSFGLEYLLGCFSTLTGAFAQWCFSKK